MMEKADPQNNQTYSSTNISAIGDLPYHLLKVIFFI